MNERDTHRSQFAAYLTGRLPAEDRAIVQRALADDPELAGEVDALRPVASLLERDLGGAASFRLSPDRLAVIRATASKHIVEFPGSRAAASSRAASVYLRRWVPALAASAAVIIGAITGFSTGRENFEGGSTSVRVATQIEPVSSASDADIVYSYTPTYGLDHYTSGLTRNRMRPAELATFGLPGPRSPYLLRGDQLLLQ